MMYSEFYAQQTVRQNCDEVVAARQRRVHEAQELRRADRARRRRTLRGEVRLDAPKSSGRRIPYTV